MNIFTAMSLLNALTSGYMMYVSIRKLTSCNNPYIIQIVNIAPWLSFVSILLHLSCVAYGSINSIWDVRLLAWQVWDFLILLMASRLINVVSCENEKTP